MQEEQSSCTRSPSLGEEYSENTMLWYIILLLSRNGVHLSSKPSVQLMKYEGQHP